MERGELWVEKEKLLWQVIPPQWVRRPVSSAGALGSELDWGSGSTPSRITSNGETGLGELQFPLWKMGYTAPRGIIVRIEQNCA